MVVLRDIADRIRKRLRPEKKPAEPLYSIGDEVEITYHTLPNTPFTHVGTILDIVPGLDDDERPTYQVEFFPHGPGLGWIQYFREDEMGPTKQRRREMRLEELGIFD